MADEELHKTPTDGQTEVEASVTVEEAEPTTADQGKGAHDDHPTLAEAATYVENDEIPLGKIQSVLDSTVDESQLTPQMRRMMQRQKENSKRVEESIKGTKANPSWYVPLFCTLMVIGLVWAVVFYLTNNTYPIPGIGFWNLAIAFGFILVGFLMTVGWRCAPIFMWLRAGLCARGSAHGARPRPLWRTDSHCRRL